MQFTKSNMEYSNSCCQMQVRVLLVSISQILQYTCIHVCFSHVRLFATPWTVAHQVPLSMDSPGKHTGIGSHSLLQGIFLTQGLNLGLLHCRQILYHPSHGGSPHVQIFCPALFWKKSFPDSSARSNLDGWLVKSAAQLSS